MIVPGQRGTLSGYNCVVTSHSKMDLFSRKKMFLLEFDQPTGWTFKALPAGLTTIQYGLAVNKHYFWLYEDNKDFKIISDDVIPSTQRNHTISHGYSCHRCSYHNEYISVPNMTGNRWLCRTCHDYSWAYAGELL